jgi:hypothetical protein
MFTCSSARPFTPIASDDCFPDKAHQVAAGGFVENMPQKAIGFHLFDAFAHQHVEIAQASALTKHIGSRPIVEPAFACLVMVYSCSSGRSGDGPNDQSQNENADESSNNHAGVQLYLRRVILGDLVV